LIQIFAQLNQGEEPTPPPSLVERGLELLPTAGGMAGGLIGGAGGSAFGLGFGGLPGAIGGATLGGAGGEAVKQLLERVLGMDAPTSPLDAATEIGRAGATEGALEGVGGAAVRGLRGTGRAMVRKAVRPNPSLQRDFPGVDIVQTLIDERLPVGASGRAAAARSASGAATDRLLQEAGEEGVRFAPRTIAASAEELGQDLLARGLKPTAPEFGQLGELVTDWVGKHADELTPNQVKDLKRAAQQLSKAVMRMEAKAGGAEAASLAAQFQRAISRGAKDALETIPGVARQERRTQGLIAGTKALEDVEARNTLPFIAELGTPAAAAMFGGIGLAQGGPEAGLGGALLGALLFRAGANPKTLSRAGIGLNRPGVQQFVRQLPRLTASGVQQARTRP